MHQRLTLLTTLACAAGAIAVATPAAHARVAVVATGDDRPAITAFGGTEVVARPDVGGATRAVTASPDGARAFVAADRRVVRIDLTTNEAAGRSVDLGSNVVHLDTSGDGGRIFAARRGAIDIIDAATLERIDTVEVDGYRYGPFAVSNDGTVAALGLERDLVLYDLAAGEQLAEVDLTRIGAIAFPPSGGTVWVATTRGTLFGFDRDSGARDARIDVGDGTGGGLVINPDGDRAAVGPDRGEDALAIADLVEEELVTRAHTGDGAGSPDYSGDGSRIFVADRESASVSVHSGFSYKRLRVQGLDDGDVPRDLRIQPGLAVINGTEGPDEISGTRGPDQIEGLGGDDALSGFRGSDILLGGPGNDRLGGGSSSDVLDGGEGNDRLSGQVGDDQLQGGLGDDELFGGTGNDTLDGGEEADYLDGGDGDDVARGGAGDDRIIESGLGNDSLLDGGEGNDYIDGGRGSDEIFGGPGNDTLLGRTGSELIDGGTGTDTIDGGPAGDRILGREGDDAIRGDAGRDSIVGAEGNDTIDGGSGDDYLSGGFGDDVIVGGPGADEVVGGPGDDIFYVADDETDEVSCNSGFDIVYTESTAPQRDQLTESCEEVRLIAPQPSTDAPPEFNFVRGTDGDDRLFGTEADDEVFGYDGNDDLYGNGGDDYIDGEDGNDTLHGGAGDDQLYGRQGDDLLLGNEGNDYIEGARGDDVINGGAGDDTIFGNAGDDAVSGGEGNDRINVIGSGRDRVECGPGEDTVFAGPEDTVDDDCEEVRR
ncbi:MAG: hypothetical protein MSC31_13825 [Solirubrobacteraceae bacterium MAG38_C4-C5]|nr:hypothetical protein [Candidatus Siliceabacter maunaloa]